MSGRSPGRSERPIDDFRHLRRHVMRATAVERAARLPRKARRTAVRTGTPASIAARKQPRSPRPRLSARPKRLITSRSTPSASAAMMPGSASTRPRSSSRQPRAHMPRDPPRCRTLSPDRRSTTCTKEGHPCTDRRRTAGATPPTRSPIGSQLRARPQQQIVDIEPALDTGSPRAGRSLESEALASSI